MYTKTRGHEIWFCLVFIFVILQSILSLIFGSYSSYTDEIIAILGIVSIFPNGLNFIPRNIRKYIKRWYYCLIGIVIIGLISSFYSHIQPFGVIWFNDLFTCLKIFFVFVYAYKLLQKSNTDRILVILLRGVKIYIVIGFIFCIINFTTDQFPILHDSSFTRYGIFAYRFLHFNAGEYSTVLTIAIILLSVCRSRFQISGWYFLMTFVCMVATTRGKSFAMLAIFMAIVIVIRRTKHLSIRNIAIVIALGVIASYARLEEYYLSEDATPRSILLSYGIVTANDYFPLGAGFGSYGSNMAKVYYSKLYMKYGFGNIYGLSQEDSEINCLNDNFWPMIAGQFGWFGTFLYCVIVLLLFIMVRKFVKNTHLQIAAYLLFFLLVYSSTGGPVFVNNLGCSIIIVFALILKCSNEKNLCNNCVHGKIPQLF